MDTDVDVDVDGAVVVDGTILGAVVTPPSSSPQSAAPTAVMPTAASTASVTAHHRRLFMTDPSPRSVDSKMHAFRSHAIEALDPLCRLRPSASGSARSFACSGEAIAPLTTWTRRRQPGSSRRGSCASLRPAAGRSASKLVVEASPDDCPNVLCSQCRSRNGSPKHLLASRL